MRKTVIKAMAAAKSYSLMGPSGRQGLFKASKAGESRWRKAVPMMTPEPNADEGTNQDDENGGDAQSQPAIVIVTCITVDDDAPGMTFGFNLP
ncbi:hypothetical protein O1611_g8954 [Lasiodiplodia mahajangana]|uniref:Uncharacterized protein n=1 Tax=Lasiodiplodia mahajangana TaxID=1108764 RepID=A0ACC2JB29_9PEZI|nr:hypothetical protein O1611_g8954 [Lasiodiplodia mahajangana]